MLLLWRSTLIETTLKSLTIGLTVGLTVGLSESSKTRRPIGSFESKRK